MLFIKRYKSEGRQAMVDLCVAIAYAHLLANLCAKSATERAINMIWAGHFFDWSRIFKLNS